jgi:UDP-N-acetyl-D-mannosaminuronate dehydrogenase
VGCAREKTRGVGSRVQTKYRRCAFRSIDSLIQALVREGATIRAYDPEAMEKAKADLPDIEYCQDLYQAAEGADAILIVTEWEQFRDLDWSRLKGIVEQALIVDGRNMFDPNEVARNGFRYVSVGRLSTSRVDTSETEVARA